MDSIPSSLLTKTSQPSARSTISPSANSNFRPSPKVCTQFTPHKVSAGTLDGGGGAFIFASEKLSSGGARQAISLGAEYGPSAE
jgi:hypothetical protein